MIDNRGKEQLPQYGVVLLILILVVIMLGLSAFVNLGYLKIACSVSVRSYGIIRYEYGTGIGTVQIS